MKRSWKSVVSIVPSLAVALLPSFSCPSCWPAYAAFMSAIGLGVYDYSEYLIPITAAAITFSLVMLGWQALRRKSYPPLILAIAGSIVHIVGRFILESQMMSYLGIGLIFIASIWVSLPKRRGDATRLNCGHCPPQI
jgi:hypothetical protein